MMNITSIIQTKNILTVLVKSFMAMPDVSDGYSL